MNGSLTNLAASHIRTANGSCGDELRTAAVEDRLDLVHASPSALAGVLYLGLIVTTVPLVLCTWVLSNVAASAASATLLLIGPSEVLAPRQAAHRSLRRGQRARHVTAEATA